MTLKFDFFVRVFCRGFLKWVYPKTPFSGYVPRCPKPAVAQSAKHHY